MSEPKKIKENFYIINKEKKNKVEFIIMDVDSSLDKETKCDYAFAHYAIKNIKLMSKGGTDFNSIRSKYEVYTENDWKLKKIIDGKKT